MFTDKKYFSIIKNVCTRVILYNKRGYGYFRRVDIYEWENYLASMETFSISKEKI